MRNRQLVTASDWMEAILDYVIEQTDGRLRATYPGHDEVIDAIVGSLQNPYVRMSPIAMQCMLSRNVQAHVACLNDCAVKFDRCDCNEETHKFMRDFLNLVWGARDEVKVWLFR